MKLEIAESAEYLEKSMKQAQSGAQKERLQMLWWVKTNQVSQHQELSARLGRDPSTIRRWLQKYRRGGLKALLEMKHPPGATPKIQGEARSALEARLESPEGFRSYGDIVDWLKQSFGLELKYGTVYRCVRDELKGELKIPRPVSVHQHPEAVDTFKKTFPWRS
ncbi:MAG: helix-turn-helix domain-containing protein [Cyanothece sp. SIO1E1]|nr:helix-turn-helix domain-containing protein [Cyanothece sp. SIO1E1]